MALGRGRRVALAVVAGGLLLIACIGIAHIDAIIQRWRDWKTEQATLKRLSTERLTISFSIHTPLREALKVLSSLGLKSATTPEVTLAMEKNADLLIKPLTLHEATWEEVLRSILVSADQNLEYTIKGDTVVVRLRASPGCPRDRRRRPEEGTEGVRP